MAYDEDLANRIREQLADEHAVTEKRMFGSLAFLLSGNLAVCARADDVLVRVGPDNTEDALARPHTSLLEMGARPMKGWVLVGGPAIADAAGLGEWVGRGVEFARSLPPKG